MVNTRNSLKKAELQNAAVNGAQQIMLLHAPNQGKACSVPASKRFPVGYIRRGAGSQNVKNETKYGDIADNSHLQLQNADLQLCDEVDFIQVVYPTDKKLFFIEANPVLDKPHGSRADSNTTSVNLSDMLALDDAFSSIDSKSNNIVDLDTLSGYKVKTEFGPILRGILIKYGDIAANSKKSIEFRSLLLEKVCEIVRKLEATEFVCLSTVEIDSFRVLLKDMEIDVNVGWLVQRLDQLKNAKKLLRESPIVKRGKMEKETEIIVSENELRKLQEKIKYAQNAIELKKEEKMEFDKVLSNTKVQLKKYGCGSMTIGLI